MITVNIVNILKHLTLYFEQSCTIRVVFVGNGFKSKNTGYLDCKYCCRVI